MKTPTKPGGVELLDGGQSGGAETGSGKSPALTAEAAHAGATKTLRA